MDLDKLSYFHYAATYSNFSMAAKECHIAQTAMSRHIADIEKEIGVELFKRMPKKVFLTPAGEFFFRETREIIKRYNEVLSSVKDIAVGCDDTLKIAFGFYERSLLPEYILPFVEKYPRISITTQQYTYDILIQELEKGNCDVAFCPPNWTLIHNNIRSVALHPSSNYFALSNLHPFAQCTELSTQQIDGQTVIVPASDRPLKAFELLCNHFKIKPNKVITANTFEAMISMIETNIGIALVPSYVIDNYKGITFLPFNYTLMDDKRHAAICLKPALKPAVTLFLDEVALLAENRKTSA